MFKTRSLLIVILILSIFNVPITFAQDEGDKIELNPQLLWQNKLNLQPQWISINANIVTTSSAFSSMIVNFDLKSGRLLWNYNASMPTVAEPILVDENLVFVHKNNSISVLNQKTGEIKAKWLVFPYDDILAQETKEKELKSKITQEYDREKARERTEIIKELRRVKKLMLKDKLNHQKQLAYGQPVLCGKSIFFLAQNGMMTNLKKDLQEVKRYYLPVKDIKHKLFYAPPCALLTDEDDEDETIELYALTTDGILYNFYDGFVELAITEEIGTKYDEFRLPPYLANKKIYLISTNGTVYCYKIGIGRPQKLWSKRTAAKKSYQVNQQGELIVEPCFNEKMDTIYLNSQGTIRSINATNGRTNWITNVKSSIPVVYWENYLIVATEDKELLFLNAHNGTIEKSLELPTVPCTKLVIWGDHLLVGDKDSLYCWQLANRNRN